MPHVRIRNVEARDASRIAGLMQGLGFDHAPDEIGRRLNLVADRNTDPAFLAEGDTGKPLGLLAPHIAPLLFYPQPLARITTRVVAEDERRHGIGRRLVALAYEHAKGAGCDTLELTTGLDRASAHAFYEAVGFHRSALRMHRRVR